jgi:2-desacetyl-2-hydroxyethyl bacteriochlorophyllide A dehydrogenase
MQVAVVTGPGQVELREETVPEPGPEQLVVEVAACGLCTMERRLFAGEKKVYPVAPGHEVAGRVVAAGQTAAALPGVPTLGQMVTVDLLTRCGACRPCRRGQSALCQRPQGGALSDGTISMGAGLAQFVVVDARQAWAVGDATDQQAAMGEPLACVAHSLRRGGFRAGDRVAVIGAGYMGRLHLALTRHGGASQVGLVDVSDTRLADASAAGASWVAAPETSLATGGPHDIVFVTAGAPGAIETALSLCDKGGTVVVYGAFPKELTVSVGPDAFHHHELSIIGVYSQEPEDWRTSAGLIASGTLAKDLDALVTARFDLSDVGEALRLVATSPSYRVLVGP